MRRITVYILAAAVKYSHRCSDMGIASTPSPACLTAMPTLPACWSVVGDVCGALGVTFVHRHSLGLMGGRVEGALLCSCFTRGTVTVKVAGR